MFDSLNPLYFYPYNDENDRKDDNVLFAPKEATLYGNIFRNEYVPYKNYVPKLQEFKNAKEKLLMDINYYRNAAEDLGLYLSIYPTNKEYSELYEKYAYKAKDLIHEFEEKYGPIEMEDSRYKNGYFSYITTPSTWLKGE